MVSKRSSGSCFFCWRGGRGFVSWLVGFGWEEKGRGWVIDEIEKEGGRGSLRGGKRRRRGTGGNETYQIRLPQPFARAKKLITRRARNDKILGVINTADAIEAADKRLARRAIDARHHGADKKRAEAFLVQAGGDQVGHGLRRDGPLLAQSVHVDFEPEEV